MAVINFYSNLLLSHHPLLRNLANNAPSSKLFRLSFRLWTEASGKGYGAHLGSAYLPIALYQRKRVFDRCLIDQRRGYNRYA
jgi:hypothetical protein